MCGVFFYWITNCLHPRMVYAKFERWKYEVNMDKNNDDEKISIGIAHSSLPLRWAKKGSLILRKHMIIP